jgi:hypothetical protein
VEKTARVFRSFEEAERADREFYRSLTPPERLDILLDLVRENRPADETERRLERVYRIVELERR